MPDAPSTPALPTPRQVQVSLAAFDQWAAGQHPAPAAEDRSGRAAATAEAEAARTAAQARAEAIAKGDKTALAQLEAEVAAAPKEASDAPADATGEPANHGAPDAVPEQPYDFGPAFSRETPAAKILDANKATHSIVLGLGYDQAQARGAVEMIARAQAARGAKPMDTIEHNKLDFILREKFGGQFDARMDRVQAALNKLGPVRGGQLQHVMNTIGPDAAAWMFETLSREQAR